VLYDVSGRALRTLLDGRYEAGTQDLVWDGRDERGLVAPAGLYFVRANVEGSVLTRRVVRLR
jgi:flagellar hook assembly protein FlgD